MFAEIVFSPFFLSLEFSFFAVRGLDRFSADAKGLFSSHSITDSSLEMTKIIAVLFLAAAVVLACRRSAGGGLKANNGCHKPKAFDTGTRTDSDGSCDTNEAYVEDDEGGQSEKLEDDPEIKKAKREKEKYDLLLYICVRFTFTCIVTLLKFLKILGFWTHPWGYFI